MAKILYKMPDGRYIAREKTFKTKFIQKKSGRMAGRKRVKGKGDGVGVKRVKKDFILVKRGKIARGHKRRKEYNSGQILGRF